MVQGLWMENIVAGPRNNITREAVPWDNADAFEAIINRMRDFKDAHEFKNVMVVERKACREWACMQLENFPR